MANGQRLAASRRQTAAGPAKGYAKISFMNYKTAYRVKYFVKFDVFPLVRCRPSEQNYRVYRNQHCYRLGLNGCFLFSFFLTRSLAYRSLITRLSFNTLNAETRYSGHGVDRTLFVFNILLYFWFFFVFQVPNMSTIKYVVTSRRIREPNVIHNSVRIVVCKREKIISNFVFSKYMFGIYFFVFSTLVATDHRVHWFNGIYTLFLPPITRAFLKLSAWEIFIEWIEIRFIWNHYHLLSCFKYCSTDDRA